MYKVFVSIHSPFIFLYCKVQLVLDEYTVIHHIVKGILHSLRCCLAVV